MPEKIFVLYRVLIIFYALPVFAALANAGATAGLITIVNSACDQYPDVDFDKPAPVETGQ